MKITILGSGTSTGVPMVGCRCPVCSSPHDPRDKRSRSSILIQQADKNILVDCTTDLRFQMLREAVPKLDAVLFTHTHADHVNGIDDLRGFHFLHQQVIPAYGCPDTIKRLTSNFDYIFQNYPNATHPPLLSAHPVTGMFELFGLAIQPIPLIHGSCRTCGYRIANFAYLTDCSAIPERSMDLLHGVSCLILDGLRWQPHPYHFNIPQAIEAAQQIGAERVILTHLTHEVSHTDQARLPNGVQFAYDGMVLEV